MLGSLEQCVILEVICDHWEHEYVVWICGLCAWVLFEG